MQYKTMCLQMIQGRPSMYDQLLHNQTLLPTLNQYASQLRTSHLEWKERLAQARPGSDSQIAGEALEIALKEMEDSLPPAYPQDEDGTFSLDAAMAFLRRHTPPV